ncbi:MAG: hypothetical protein Q9169_006339 [Polycauliona sp. 2 TL-2023]
MGRELQKKKNKSSLNKVKHKPKSKKLNLQANPIVAKNWYVITNVPSSLILSFDHTEQLIMFIRNKKETLSQNYRRLGLVSKLNPRAGGIEPSTSSIPPPGARKDELRDSLAISNVNSNVLIPGSARIIRDAKGEVVRVVHEGGESGGKRKIERVWGGRKLVDELGSDGDEDGDEDEGKGEVGNTQHDLLATRDRLTSDVGGGGGGEVASQLANLAAVAGEKKRPRKQSQREEEWVERLVERYGDDVGAMARDRKLNPMQQSRGDLAKRIRTWREGRKKDGGTTGDGGEDMETE